MTELSFEVEGIPIAQGSKRAFNHRHTGRVVMLESAGDRLKQWRQKVTLAARQEATKRFWEPPEAVKVNMLFFMPRPKGHYGTGRNAGTLRPSAPEHHTVKPDSDKLARAVNDALTDAGVIRDDSTITMLVIAKAYAKNYPPGAHISITKETQ